MKITSRLLLFLSFLPDGFLYKLSNVGAFFFRVFGYRKRVILTNLSNAFPNKTEKECKQIMKRFYSHLVDLFVESIMSLRLSEKEVLKRYHCINPEVASRYFDEGKSILLVSGHYNNWEYMVLSLALQLPFHGIGVGKRLSDRKMDTWINSYRQRYGTEVIFAENAKEKFAYYEENKIPTAYMMLIDQSPNDKNKAHWMTFLHQDSGVIFGAEYFSVKYNYPVLCYIVRKKKRGYYELEMIDITASPQKEAKGMITESCMKCIEKEIIERPEYWLWSHKRWKHKRPV